MNYKIISPNIPFENKENSRFLILGGLAIASIVVVNMTLLRLTYEMQLIIFLGSLMMLGVFRKLLPDWTRKNDVIGFLEIDNDQRVLKVNNTILGYSNIAGVELQFNYIKGHRFSVADVIHNGISILQLSTSSGRSIEFKFQIETKLQYEYLKEVLCMWYRSGVKINETFTKERLETICLNPIMFMSYEERKEMNKRIAINNIHV